MSELDQITDTPSSPNTEQPDNSSWEISSFDVELNETYQSDISSSSSSTPSDLQDSNIDYCQSSNSKFDDTITQVISTEQSERGQGEPDRYSGPLSSASSLGNETNNRRKRSKDRTAAELWKEKFQTLKKVSTVGGNNPNEEEKMM
ncbi:uncharacterized protein L201_000978 [Kwoniella dendrophila CBS 6074]|uniref:BZIP domain-containing protein n=1 Tax=Kwoniella dendrophila CBS 6074 TaxID=1295534 RepID=A0AAX4JL24_9TREE